MLHWLAVILTAASLSLNIYFTARTWRRYWRKERQYFFTKHMAPSVRSRDGVHFVPLRGLKICNEMRKIDRRYAKSALRISWFGTLGWSAIVLFLLWNATTIS